MNLRLRKRGGGGDRSAGSKGSNRGKITTGSLVVTAVGAVVRDLRRPDSLIRSLVSTAREKLVARRIPRKEVDIGDKVKVEFIDDDSSSLKKDNNENHKKEA